MHIAMTPRNLPNPGPPPTPEKTLSRWTLFLGSIAAGMKLPDAMQKHYITRADIEAAIRSGPDERKRWDEARLAAVKIGWSAFDFEDIFERIAGGSTVTHALQDVKGKGNSNNVFANFNRIVTLDSTLNEQYINALKCRSLVMQEEIIEEADDDSKDVIYNDKGPAPNNAAVNRSKLKVETRLRLMSAWNTKMFGEQKNAVQVNVQVNHAEKLEQARARAVTRNVAPAKIPQKLIEAAFKDLPPVKAQEADWDDVPPAKAQDMDWDVVDPAKDLSWLQ